MHRALHRFKITIHRISARIMSENFKNLKSFHILAENFDHWKSEIEYWLNPVHCLRSMASGA